MQDLELIDLHCSDFLLLADRLHDLPALTRFSFLYTAQVTEQHASRFATALASCKSICDLFLSFDDVSVAAATCIAQAVPALSNCTRLGLRKEIAQGAFEESWFYMPQIVHLDLQDVCDWRVGARQLHETLPNTVTSLHMSGGIVPPGTTLPDLTNLQELDIRCFMVATSFVQHFSSLVSLRTLSMPLRPLRVVCGLHMPALLDDATVSLVASLRSLSSLVQLDISGCWFPLDAVHSLVSLSQLQHLHMAKDHMFDQTALSLAEHVSALCELRSFTFHECPLGPTMLLHRLADDAFHRLKQSLSALPLLDEGCITIVPEGNSRPEF